MSQFGEHYGGHGRTSEDNILARQSLLLWGTVFMEVVTIEWAREGHRDFTACWFNFPESVPGTLLFLPVLWEERGMQSSRGRVLQRSKATKNRKRKEPT